MNRLVLLVCLAAFFSSVEGRADAPAATGPLLATIDVDLTQVISDGTNTYLFVHVSIENQSLRALRLSAASVKLHVGERVQQHAVPETGQRPISVVVSTGGLDEKPAAEPPIRGRGLRSARGGGESAEKAAAELPWFEDGDLPVGKKRSGWLCFDLTELGHVDNDLSIFAGPPWTLVVRSRDGTASFDLKEHEIRALAARRRASHLDPRVSVIEIGSRLNSLNVAALAEIAESILAREPGFVAVFSQGACLIEESAGGRLDRVDSSWPDMPKIVVDRDQAGVHAYRLGWHGSADSEAAATVAVLAQRLDAVPTFIKYLSEGPLDVRLAAAEALAPHVASMEVRDALVRAARPSENDATPTAPPAARGRPFAWSNDMTPETKLRMAALRALGSTPLVHAPGRGPDSADTRAVIEALNGRDEGVRYSAVEVADRFPYPRVFDSLTALLDNPEVQTSAFEKLRMMGHFPEREKLEALRDEDPPGLRYSAIGALEAIGAMSHAEALLAKLDAGNLSRDDCLDLVRLKDPRSIPKLLGLTKNKKYVQESQPAVETLIALQMPETVEPLIELLTANTGGGNAADGRRPRGERFVHFHPGTREAIIRALAALGDRRAIAPIRGAMNADQYAPLQRRLVYLDALLELHDPDALMFTEQPAGMDDPAQVEALLTMLARHDDERVLPLLEEFLHKEQFAALTAEKLSYLLSDEAQKALAGRLKQADHPLQARWVEGVSRNPIWLADHRAIVPDAIAAPVPSEGLRGYEGVNQRQISRQRWPRRETLGDCDALSAWFKHAPRVPTEAVKCHVDSTQQLGDCLVLRLSLANHTDAALKVAAADFALQAGGECSAAMRLLADAPPPTVVARGMTHVLNASAISYWKDAEVPPGTTAQGWLAFEFASATRTLPSAFDEACTLWIKAGDGAAAFDLRENECGALHLTDRRSSLHKSLHVIEMNGRLNSLNVRSFIERLRDLTADDRGYLLVANPKSCLVSSHAVSAWHDWLKKHATAETMPVLVVGKRQDDHVWNSISSEVRRYATEDLAAVALLERLPGSAKILLAHLVDPRYLVRRAVAEALSHHLAEQGVAEALVALFNDPHPAVRMAAALAIAEPKQPLPDALRRAGLPMETAVLAAMNSPDQTVARLARHAARWFATERVEQMLLEFLDACSNDPSALSSLIELNPKAAVERLRRCLTGGEYVRAFALEQLDKLGEISHVEAVLGRLDERHAGIDAFQQAGKIKDPRIVAKLISLIEESDLGVPPRPRIDSLATQALVELRAKEAVEPLCALLNRPAWEGEALSIARVVAQFDDPRAIGPIRHALQKAPVEWRLRLDYYVALARLGDREALTTLVGILSKQGDARWRAASEQLRMPMQWERIQ